MTATPPIPLTILLTRPAPQSGAFAALLRPRIAPAIPILVAPILEIVPLPVPPLARRPRFVVLTSVHAAAALAALPEVRELAAYCVGDSTAAAARAAGAQAISAGGDAAALRQLLERERPEGPGLHLRGRHVAADFADLAGIDSVAVYDQVARPLDAGALAALDGAARVILPVFSPRSARLLGAACAGRRAPRAVVAISTRAAAAWPEPAEIAAVAAVPEAEAMADAVARIATVDRLVDPAGPG